MYGGTWPPHRTVTTARTDCESPLDGADDLIDALPATLDEQSSAELFRYFAALNTPLRESYTLQEEVSTT